MADVIKEALVLQGQFIAEGLIEQVGDGWKLTELGKVKAVLVLNKLTNEEKALVLLYVGLLLKKGKQK